MNHSKFEELYKYKNKIEHKQSERRAILLNEQKRLRNQCLDNNRDLTKYKATFTDHHHKKQKKFNPHFKDKTQLSEWMPTKPEDIQDWYLVPCPKGQRCLIVANSKQTEVYNKSGYIIKIFNSNLPGDIMHHSAVTILDAFFVSSTNTFYLIDVIIFGNHDMINCDAEFRFYWLKSKTIEHNLNEISATNQCQMVSLDFYDFNDEESIKMCLSKYPMWDNDTPKLDGILFYHKESSYVYGETPLVGWLFIYMLPEIFNINYVNPIYLLEKPKNYIDCKSFIDEFNFNLEKKKRKSIKKHNLNLETDDDLESSMELEHFDES